MYWLKPLQSKPWISVSTLIFLTVVCFATQAGVAGLPDSAQPGAIKPDIDRSELPKSDEAEVVEIPAVIERPLAVDEGDRILVKQFELINAEELPELNITVAEVTALVESLRQERPQGFTIGWLQEVANQVTRYYRDKGLVLAQAVIPVQDVAAGTVKIEIFVGYLDRVLVEGNTVYDQEVLQAVFDDLLNRPIIQSQIEAALLRLTDYPGLRVYGVFQPGQLIGTADIVINVQQEERFETAFRVDNHGTQETGRIRGRVNFDWNSLFAGPDQLSLLFQQTYNPKQSEFIFLEYQRYLPYQLLIGVSWDQSDYGVGGQFADQQITGDSEDFSVFLEKSFIRSRQENLAAAIRFTRSRSDVQRAGIDETQEVLSVINLTTQYDALDNWNPFGIFLSEDSDFETSAINFFSFEISQGLEGVLGALGSNSAILNLPNGQRPGRQGGSGEFATGEFTRIFAGFTRYQNISYSQSLLFRSEFQWSEDLLLSQEQYSIGGPNSVRAFSPSFQLVDRAGFMSLEYIIDAPIIGGYEAFQNYTWEELLQFSIYYDVAFGKLNDPAVFDEVGWKSYQGIGIGAQFNLPGRFDSRFLMAWPLGTGNQLDSDVGNGREPQIWLDLSISF